MQELYETRMTARIHTLWLMASPADESMLTALVGELSRRFDTPLFVPHLTLLGDSTLPVATLENAAAAAADKVAVFSEQVAAIEGSETFFRSFYARLAVSPAFVSLKQALDPGGLEGFMPHVSLLYGAVEPVAKAAAMAEVAARLVGRPIRFDRIGIVTSGQEVPLSDWHVVANLPLRSA